MRLWGVVMFRESPSLPWPGGAAGSHGGRQLVAALLQRGSMVLARMALSLAGSAPQGPPREPLVEFYAEAGAPEGALFVDGELVGMLVGVSRL